MMKEQDTVSLKHHWFHSLMIVLAVWADRRRKRRKKTKHFDYVDIDSNWCRCNEKNV